MYHLKKQDIWEATLLFGTLLIVSLYFSYLYTSLQDKNNNQFFHELDPQSMPNFLNPIYSTSLVVMEQDTGKILFAKNSEILFPPASLTKLVTLYIIYDQIHKGNISKDTIVPISTNAWAKMLPRDASRMFLEPGQIVTMYDLMLGLAIPSGNDAAIAVAEFLAGSVPEFVKIMNQTMLDLGLHHIHFEDANGYSSNSYITAQEFALFCREYLRRFPEAIDELHTVPVIKFPQKQHYPAKFAGKHHIITQLNTNPLLGRLEGADGLKTGYLGKSGFNIAVSVKRGNVRLIVVDLGSFAGIAKMANENRVNDIIKVVNYIYDTYHMYNVPTNYRVESLGISVKVPIPDGKIYHYSPIINTKPYIHTLGRYIIKGQVIGKLEIKDELGQKAFYPIISEDSIPPQSISDVLWSQIFRIGFSARISHWSQA